MVVVLRVSWLSRRRRARLLDEIVVHRRRRRRLGGTMAILGSDANSFGVRGTVVAPIVAPGNDEVVLNAPAYTDIPSNADPYGYDWWYGWDTRVPAPDPNARIPGWQYGEWPQRIFSGGGNPLLTP